MKIFKIFIALILIFNLTTNNIYAIPQNNKQEKSPIIAATLSLFIPGLGQIYAEEPYKGLAILGGTALLIGAYITTESLKNNSTYSKGQLETISFIITLGGLGGWLWNFTDAYNSIINKDKNNNKESENESSQNNTDNID